ncbi:MAG: hypothetical protein O9346_04685 [Leptospiraceae bacterium]|jgi:hypothetical protein|nr:hypothetical protein [Leptospiraceae bacterium]MCZ8345692.1 hypothetical protein [Leptospiraceae bacterium]
MPGNVEEAIFFLRDGEFEKAKTIFSLLLDGAPQDETWKAGYYISSFWDNKLDHLLSLSEGKERGKALLNYLDLFETEIVSRKFPRDTILQTALQCVLEEAIHHLRISFRMEGWNGLDLSSLKGLSICHLRLGEFSQALEILEPISKSSMQSSEYGYLIAECYLGTGLMDDGKNLYLHSFLDDPLRFNRQCNFWTDLQLICQEIDSTQMDGESKSFAIPVLGLRRGIFRNQKPKKKQDLDHWMDQMIRLNHFQNTQTAKFQKKTAWRTQAFALSILENFSERDYPNEINRTKRFLDETNSILNGELPQ